MSSVDATMSLVISVVILLAGFLYVYLRRKRLADNTGKTDSQIKSDSVKLKFFKGEISKKEYMGITKTERKKVNMKWQTLSVIIPFTFLLASNKVQKFGKGFLVMFVAGFVSSIIMQSLVERMNFQATFGLIIGYGIYIMITIYFIRKWSNEWNKKIDLKVNDNSTPETEQT